ncbi:MAG: hypothetical protein IPN15_20350 [Saprospiraceae bacterium]|nr:hypothetical protein [Candidatus Vicinibacter affinis]
MTPINIVVNGEYKDGFTSIADINSDGILDVVVSSPGFSGQAVLYAYCIINNTPILYLKQDQLQLVISEWVRQQLAN